jgi:hypothetical protein
MVDNDQDPDDAVRHPHAPNQIAHQNEPGNRLNQNAQQNEYRKTKGDQAAAEEVLTRMRSGHKRSSRLEKGSK